MVINRLTQLGNLPNGAQAGAVATSPTADLSATAWSVDSSRRALGYR